MSDFAIKDKSEIIVQKDFWEKISSQLGKSK
jgi:hypothetical protein